MSLLRPGIRRLFRIRRFGSSDAMRDVDDEMRMHLDMRAEDLMREGFDAATAAAEARRRFASDDDTMRTLYATARDRNRRMRFRERWESLEQDLRYAARGLRRDPLLATFVILALALGIGVNVTTLGLLDRLLLRGPEHVQHPDRLARLYRRLDNMPAGRQTGPWIPFTTARHLREGMTAFDLIGAYRIRDAMVGRGPDARKRHVEQTLGAFFSALGTRPLRGRFFSADEDAATTGPMVVLSEALWRSDFGASDSVIGRSVLIGDEPHVIIGVAPTGFTGPELRRIDAWTLASSATGRTVNWNVFGRMRPGVTIAEVAADAANVHRRTSADGSQWMRNATILAAPIGFGESATEPAETTMARWLAAVAAIILLITLANVVNLLLTRLARRRRELAVRVALGAGRGRVMRLLIFEGSVLAALGGAVSLFVAALAEPILTRTLFVGEAGWTFSMMDARLLAIVVAVVLATALLIGLFPAARAAGPHVTSSLRSGAQIDGGTSRLRTLLTAAQASLSVMLLIGTGLFVRSLARVHSLDLGVDADRVVMAEAALPLPRVVNAATLGEREANERSLYRRYLAAVRHLPGVRAAAVSLGIPFDGGSFAESIFVPGVDSIPVLAGGGPYVSAVTDEYFATIGARLLRGRAFTSADRENAEAVVIVGEAMARKLWRADPIGQCVHVGGATAPCSRVVGVVGDVHRIGLHEEPSLQYYLPLGQLHGFSGATLLVRPDPTRPVDWGSLRRTMLDVDPTINAVDIRLLVAGLDGSIRPLRIGMTTFGFSGALALLVAMLGLYGLMSYHVAWRTREIGVRVALGATDTHIARLIVTSGVRVAGLGIAVGVIVSLIGARWLEPHLFETSAHDPLVVTTAAAALLLVSFVAGWVPARRAARISPTEALRAE